MRSVSVLEAKTQLSSLIKAVEAGEEVVITRRGAPVARLAAVEKRIERVPGDLRAQPGWEDFVYDPALFAPMTDDEADAEGWNG
jgi:prevent-host-death family protein